MPNKTRWVQIGVLSTALLQASSPLLFSLAGNSDLGSNQTDPPITPAGYTFVIWGAITLLALAFGIYQFARKGYQTLHQEVGPYLIATYLGFGAWLFAAGRGWLWLTVLIFIGMFFCLWQAYDRVIASRDRLSPAEVILLNGQLGLYTGWTTVAIFANLGAALKQAGLPDTGVWGTSWQATLLLGATLNGIYGIRRSAGLFYAATVLWALVGVFFGLREFENTLALQVITFSAIIAVLATFFYYKHGPGNTPIYS